MKSLWVALAILGLAGGASAGPIYGVNTHINQGQSETQILAATSVIRTTNLRDYAINAKTGPNQVAAIFDLAARGYHFDFITGGDLASTVTQLHKLELAHPGSITAVEGPNEINNFGFGTYAPNTTAIRVAARSYQLALYTAMKTDPILAKIPVLGFTDNPYPAGLAGIDAASVHFYPTAAGVAANFPYMSKILTSDLNANPGKPIWVTETGFSLAAGFSQATQATALQAELPRLAAFNPAAIYVYELLDWGATFGLFNRDGTPRPAATAYAKIIAGP